MPQQKTGLDSCFVHNDDLLRTKLWLDISLKTAHLADSWIKELYVAATHLFYSPWRRPLLLHG